MGLCCWMRKITYCRRISFKKGQNLYPIRGIRFCPFLFSRRGIPTVILQFGYSRTQKIREVSKGGQRPPFGSGSSKRGESIPVGIGYPKGNSVALGRGIQRGQRPPWHTILLCKVRLAGKGSEGIYSPRPATASPLFQRFFRFPLPWVMVVFPRWLMGLFRCLDFLRIPIRETNSLLRKSRCFLIRSESP